MYDLEPEARISGGHGVVGSFVVILLLVPASLRPKLIRSFGRATPKEGKVGSTEFIYQKTPSRATAFSLVIHQQNCHAPGIFHLSLYLLSTSSRLTQDI